MQGRLLGFLLLVPALGSSQEERPDEGHPSARNASYSIEVELDPETKTLSATEIITWRNIQPVATDELRLHLYWNAWRNNRSTWLLESRLRSRGSDRDDPVLPWAVDDRPVDLTAQAARDNKWIFLGLTVDTFDC